jgi:hypothetical protein
MSVAQKKLLRTSGAGLCHYIVRVAAAIAVFGRYDPVDDFRIALR